MTKNEDHITIAMVCDDHLVVMLAVLLKSIERNHLGEKLVDIYIIDDGIKKRNIEKINRTISSNKIRILWVKMEETIPDDLPIPLDNSLYTLNTYARLFLCYFLPKEVSKAIYLDADMVVLNDIEALWDTDITHHTIAAVNDINKVVSSPWGGIKNYKELGIDPETKYFNAGLLLINLDRWKEKDVTRLVLNTVKKNGDFAQYPDQYGLNVVFADNWFELDPKWNVFASVYCEDPFLIHFTGVKPLFKGYNYSLEYKKIFYDFVKLTPWASFSPQNNYKWQIKIVKNIIKKRSWDTLIKKSWEVVSKRMSLGM